jgi:BMFP domain-containing protein YqiC
MARSSRRLPRPVSRAEFDELRQVLDQCRRDIEIQFKRIAQMQAEFDQIRRAWTKTEPVKKQNG